MNKLYEQGGTILLSNEVWKQLQELAEPLVDTPSSVIQKLIDHYKKTKDVTKEASKKEKNVVKYSQPETKVKEKSSDSLQLNDDLLSRMDKKFHFICPSRRIFAYGVLSALELNNGFLPKNTLASSVFKAISPWIKKEHITPGTRHSPWKNSTYWVMNTLLHLHLVERVADGWRLTPTGKWFMFNFRKEAKV